MDHGSFQLETKAQASQDEITITLRGATAVGDLTGSRPSATATWRGVMVGTPTRGNHRDNILQGDAEIVYDGGEQTINAEFTNIVDLDRNASHDVQTVSFINVPVDQAGIYEANGGVNNSIEGAFGGPAHEETGGVFVQQGIVGAFGAKMVD